METEKEYIDSLPRNYRDIVDLKMTFGRDEAWTLAHFLRSNEFKNSVRNFFVNNSRFSDTELKFEEIFVLMRKELEDNGVRFLEG